MKTALMIIGTSLALPACFSALREIEGRIACTGSWSCPPGYGCDVAARVCREGELDSGCLADADCPMGWSCARSGAETWCEPHPDAIRLCTPCEARACATDADCPTGQPCLPPEGRGLGRCDACGGPDGRCALEGSGTPCTNGASCFGEEQCIDGRCGTTLCRTTGCDLGAPEESCPHGYVCAAVSTWGPPCREAQDCGSRLCFQPDERSEARFCTCRSDRDCDEGRCVSGRCLLRSECRPAPGLTCDDAMHAR